MKKSTAIIIIGIILFLIGLGLTVISLALLGVSPEEYDAWVTDESRKEGDEIRVTGKIADKSGGEIFGFGLYSYRFEGSNQPFFSSDGSLNEGDSTTVTIVINESGLPEGTSNFSIEICLIPGIIITIVAIILFIWAFKTRRKEKRSLAYGAPQNYYPPYPHSPPPQNQPIMDMPNPEAQKSSNQDHEQNNLGYRERK